ncbi:MAG: hypothetical protein LBC84_04210 [Prevotellaceae bacterium]|jgi:hypothetical protein|nr:hypothetical protein [Prevotellaceae bacterium]
MEPINETTIRQLLASYFQGETSLAQEQQLASYFLESELPEDLLPYRALFRFFREEAAVAPPQLAPTKVSHGRRILFRLSAYTSAVAAGIIIFFALYRPVKEDFVCYQDGQRILNQEEVMQLAQQQWDQVSTQIEKATAMAEKLEQMKSYTQIINKYIPK